ncbi:phosphotransferase [Humisphaera borealis]|uniref:Phosphotransferase n=1 Tax=Humisphaera borealis TaxID=2807512 RepID=A0A7M2WQK5_9BACT|nr:phosphotransferase [Humisphaera borealis]QOV87746.1 phosphotransferase [Humisphaera borealis]
MLDVIQPGASLAVDPDELPDEPVVSTGIAARRPRGGHPGLIHLVRERLLSRWPEYRQFGPGFGVSGFDVVGLHHARDGTELQPHLDRPPSDFLFAAEDDAHHPDEVFRSLRWGGQFVYVSRDHRRAQAIVEPFIRRGFEVSATGSFRKPILGLVLPPFSRPIHYVVARKVNLILPREVSERFTYHVHLSFDPSLGKHVVVKEVPSVERVSARLRHKFPDASAELIDRRAKKFTEKVFPLFLTREAAILKLLSRDLPETYRGRVPHLIDMEQDGRGFVRRMRMSWLRAAPPGGRPISQLEFAIQSADLLRAMHDEARIIHLDLRLDNMVITDNGVGFVDFGSAVRIGENIEGNPLLNTIFDELMRTSQIQRMLEKMMVGGMVTNHILNEAYGKVDKGVDLFYLALQINKPLSNPDFRGLVKFDKSSAEAQKLSVLTEEVLKPRDPTHPTYRTAADLLAGVRSL